MQDEKLSNTHKMKIKGWNEKTAKGRNDNEKKTNEKKAKAKMRKEKN